MRVADEREGGECGWVSEGGLVRVGVRVGSDVRAAMGRGRGRGRRARVRRARVRRARVRRRVRARVRRRVSSGEG